MSLLDHITKLAAKSMKMTVVLLLMLLASDITTLIIHWKELKLEGDPEKGDFSCRQLIG